MANSTKPPSKGYTVSPPVVKVINPRAINMVAMVITKGLTLYFRIRVQLSSPSPIATIKGRAKDTNRGSSQDYYCFMPRSQ